MLVSFKKYLQPVFIFSIMRVNSAHSLLKLVVEDRQVNSVSLTETVPSPLQLSWGYTQGCYVAFLATLYDNIFKIVFHFLDLSRLAKCKITHFQRVLTTLIPFDGFDGFKGKMLGK